VITHRLASLGTLLAGVAHEINNPIAYVLGNLADLDRLVAAMREAIVSYRTYLEAHGGEQAAELIRHAESKIAQAGGLEVLDEILADSQEGAVRIRDLVRDLLEVSRGSERSSAPVDVHEILDSSLRLVSKQLSARAALYRDYQGTCSVVGDRAKLAQVFLNLLTNAIHACDPPDPGSHRVFVRTRDTPEGLEVQIEDTGTGIDPAIQDRIFTPFFTTKDVGDGTGLGLYISRRIVEEHGGEISFRCDGARGTLFIVRLLQDGVSQGEAPREDEG